MMKITPVKGTNDYLPAQAELRDYLQRKICETYENCGFQRIFTPILEDIQNLDKSEGGGERSLRKRWRADRKDRSRIWVFVTT